MVGRLTVDTPPQNQNRNDRGATEAVNVSDEENEFDELAPHQEYTGPKQ